MVTVGRKPDGKPICKLLKPESYFPTYHDAYEALMEYNKNPYDLEPSITANELYEKWTAQYFKTLRAGSSARAVDTAWKYCSAIYDMRVRDIRARHIKGCMENGKIMINGKEQTPNAFMKNKIKSLFNLMLDYALEYELVDRNYARTFSLTEETLKAIQTVKNEHIAFTKEEMRLLWEHVSDKLFADVILIQCYSGWRPQELGLIELKSVDLQKRIIIGGIKTQMGRNRIVPIHSRIMHLVRRRYNEAIRLDSPYLFNYTNPNRLHKSMMLTYPRYRESFYMIRDELKLDPRHRPHDGRKHFVTMAKQYGVDEYAIKYIVGHKISDITEKVYTQRDIDWLKGEIEKII